MTGPPPVAQWGRYRTAALAILAVAALRLGVAFTPISNPKPDEIPNALQFITAFLPAPTDHWQPVWALGYCWLALSALAFVTIWVREWHSFVFVVGTAASTYFMFAYLFATFDPAMPDRSWNTAWIYLLQAVWLCFSGLITRTGERSEKRRRRTDVDAV